MTRPLRFGHQLGATVDGAPVAGAREAEEVGFDVVLVADHVGSGGSPLVVLAAIAEATERIRLGTLVLNNDMRNPVQLAWEASTLDHLSQGRFELGLGAGHAPHEYAATGIAWRSPRLRKARLMETVESRTCSSARWTRSCNRSTRLGPDGGSPISSCASSTPSRRCWRRRAERLRRCHAATAGAVRPGR